MRSRLLPRLLAPLALALAGCQPELPDDAAFFAGTYTDPTVPASRVRLALFPDGRFVWTGTTPDDTIRVAGPYRVQRTGRFVSLVLHDSTAPTIESGVTLMRLPDGDSVTRTGMWRGTGEGGPALLRVP